MVLKTVKQLRPGDEVHWTDPDDGECGRAYTIASIEIFPESHSVRIVEDTGDVLEAFIHELS